MRTLGVAALLALVGCASAAPSAGPSTASTNVASVDSAQILGPVSMLTPPLEETPRDPSAQQTSTTSTGVATLPSAQPAPITSSPPLLDLTEGPLPAVLADGASQLRAKSWSKAKLSLAPAVSKVDAAGVPDDVIVAHTLLARAHFGLRDFSSAKREYAAASAAANAAATVVAADRDEARRHVREERLALAEAEALFASAEEARRAAEQKRIPVMRGVNSAAGISTFARKELGPWLAERRKLIEDADGAYLKVLDVKPFAPPAFAIAAGRGVGRMWDDLATSLASLPLPREWQGDGKVGETPKAELREHYQDALEQNLAPLRERARGAFQVCSEQGKRFSVQNDDVTACDDWLAKHPPPIP